MSITYPYPRNISSIKHIILRPALTHLFSCEFPVPAGLINWANGKYTDLKLNVVSSELTDKISLLCSEASLPGASLLTHEINNDYTGTTERHVYRRAYDDRADFTFYVDEDYEIIKFFHLWINYASNDRLSNEVGGGTGISGVNSIDRVTYNTRVRFPDDYKTQMMRIQKFEKNAELDSASQANGDSRSFIYNSETQKEFLNYNFINAFPISMNSMPVSYEQPSLLKCTVSFTYSRYWVSTQEANPQLTTPEGD